MHAKAAERGQVTIPEILRDRLGIAPGTVLNFEAENGRLVAVKADPVDRLEAIYGHFGKGRNTDSIVAALRGLQYFRRVDKAQRIRRSH